MSRSTPSARTINPPSKPAACSPVHSGTSDPRIGRKASSCGDGASPTRAAASRASRSGRNGTSDAVGLHRPARTVPPAPRTKSATSRTRRLFPIPARPRTTSIWPPARHACWSWASSLSRPTITGQNVPAALEVRTSCTTISHATYPPDDQVLAGKAARSAAPEICRLAITLRAVGGPTQSAPIMHIM